MRKAGLERATDNATNTDLVLPSGLISMFFGAELEARLYKASETQTRKPRRVLRLETEGAADGNI